MEEIVIIGYGEIGSALTKVYQEKGYNVKIVDPKLGKNDTIDSCDILNICIPYNDRFVEIVNNYIQQISPKLTIIHSTVMSGTTKQINGLTCHSPVRGVHPNLDTGIKTFVKYIGSESKEASNIYANHLQSLGIQYYVCKNSLTTEYAKLLDTTYYGLCIAFHSEVKNLCEQNGLNFEEVMTLYNKTYNDGYTKLEKNNVIRPVLYGTDKIGGHCVIPNAKLLKEHIDDSFLDSILKYE